MVLALLGEGGGGGADRLKRGPFQHTIFILHNHWIFDSLWFNSEALFPLSLTLLTQPIDFTGTSVLSCPPASVFQESSVTAIHSPELLASPSLCSPYTASDPSSVLTIHRGPEAATAQNLFIFPGRYTFMLSSCHWTLARWLTPTVITVPYTGTLSVHANQNVLQPAKKLRDSFFFHMVSP